jgi:citrate synthase
VAGSGLFVSGAPRRLAVQARGRQHGGRRIARQHHAANRPVPGIGHPLHKPDDPRALRLLEIAEEEGVAGSHVAAVRALSRAVDEASGKHITLNVTGAIAALLGDCGVPREILRGFSIIARAAGLVGHVREEQQKPAMRAIWETADQAIPYDGPLPADGYSKK